MNFIYIGMIVFGALFTVCAFVEPRAKTDGLYLVGGAFLALAGLSLLTGW